MPPPRLALSSDHSPIFVNREHPLEEINNAIEEIPIDGMRLKVFHGIGGQGKTALCQYVFDQVSEKKNPRYKTLLPAMVDLRGRDKTDAINLLVWIRNGFAKAQVSCAAFDIALALTWEATRPEQPFPKLTNAWLSKSSELMSDSAPDMITSVREVVEESVETIPLLGPLTTKTSKWLIDKGKTIYLKDTRSYLMHIYAPTGELKKPYELEQLLPWVLAQDLNKHLKSKPYIRFLLLIDEYERVFEQGGAGRKWEDNPFDSAMRRFVAEANGLMAVFFTRERLPWEKNPDWQDSLVGNQHALNGLVDEDARHWLTEAGVQDSDIRDVMIEGAREAPRKAIYPLLLELQLEHWRQLVVNDEPVCVDQFHVAADSLSGRCQELVKRVLRDYGAELQSVLERLSVSLRFDRIAFEHVIESVQSGLSLDVYDQVKELSLFKTADNGYVSMHRAFADIVVGTLDSEQKRKSIKLLLAHYKKRSEAPSIKEFGEEHVLTLFEASYLRRKLCPDGYIEWLSDNTQQLSKAARPIPGEQLWRLALDFSVDKFGDEHPDTALCYNNVASNLEGQGRHLEAETYFLRGLEIRQQVLGEEHLDTAVSYNNVAINLDYQGLFKKAEPLFLSALAIWKSSLGEAHPVTAKCLNNLAANLNEQWKYAEAEKLSRDALSIFLNAFGESHSAVASCYNNLGSSLSGRHRIDEAEPLLRKALGIYLKEFGEMHPDTANSYSNLAANLNNQKRYVEAEPHCRKALEVSLEVHGEEHPATAVPCNNLAFNLNAQKQYKEADPFYRKALEISQVSLGEAHLNTGMCLNGVAYNLDMLGRSEEAEPLLRKAVSIIQKVHGTDHPLTNNMEANLRNFLAKRGGTK